MVIQLRADETTVVVAALPTRHKLLRYGRIQGCSRQVTPLDEQMPACPFPAVLGAAGPLEFDTDRVLSLFAFNVRAAL